MCVHGECVCGEWMWTVCVHAASRHVGVQMWTAEDVGGIGHGWWVHADGGACDHVQM